MNFDRGSANDLAGARPADRETRAFILDEMRGRIVGSLLQRLPRHSVTFSVHRGRRIVQEDCGYPAAILSYVRVSQGTSRATILFLGGRPP